jgi:hypothetical protein
MELTVRQSGGFAGLKETIGPVDTAALPAAIAMEIESGFKAIDFLLQPARASAVGLDFVRYEFEIREGGRVRTAVGVDDGSETGEKLRALVDQLRAVGGGS